MDAIELRARQAPLKKQYREQPETARVPASAEAILELDEVACRLRSWGSETKAGLHPATGGDGSLACSADMLLCNKRDTRDALTRAREGRVFV